MKVVWGDLEEGTHGVCNVHFITNSIIIGAHWKSIIINPEYKGDLKLIMYHELGHCLLNMEQG